MSEQRIKTTVRIGDMCFNINPSADEKGLIEFNVEEMDIDRNDEEYVCNSFYGTFSPDEIEYLANRMLDAVAYFKQTYDPNGFENYLATKCAGDDEPSVSEIARHFYELGLNTRKEETK